MTFFCFISINFYILNWKWKEFFFYFCFRNFRLDPESLDGFSKFAKNFSIYEIYQQWNPLHRIHFQKLLKIFKLRRFVAKNFVLKGVREALILSYLPKVTSNEINRRWLPSLQKPLRNHQKFSRRKKWNKIVVHVIRKKHFSDTHPIQINN